MNTSTYPHTYLHIPHAYVHSTHMHTHKPACVHMSIHRQHMCKYLDREAYLATHT